MSSFYNKQYLLPIALLFLVIIVLLTTSVFILTPNIQNDLAKQIQEQLSEQLIPAKITLSGRDVTLNGTVSDIKTKQKAKVITEKVCEIRFVDNQLLTEKEENLALLSSRAPTKISTHKPQKNKPSLKPTRKPDNPPTEINDEELTTKQATRKPPKRKAVNYETMLAAMNAYQAQKGRNHKRLKATNIQFKKDSGEILPESNTELDRWVAHYKKTNNNIEITVTAKDTPLALIRAKNIRTYLANHGIKENNIKVYGKSGEEDVNIKNP